jgi:hypothetical protein
MIACTWGHAHAHDAFNPIPAPHSGPLTAMALEESSVSRGITVSSESAGIGTHPAQAGDIVLFHYVGEDASGKSGHIWPVDGCCAGHGA